MGTFQRYTASDLAALVEKINKHSIGMDATFDRLNLPTSTSYPPYNLIQISNVESRLELALAGFKTEELKVYTEYGQLFIEGKKEETEEKINYLHKGVAQRSFARQWTVSEDTQIRSVTFEDGLLVVSLGKVVPEHHARKDYL